MLPKPFLQFRKPEATALIQGHQELVRGMVIEPQAVAIHPKKSCRRRDGHALVPVHERMVLGEALPKRRGLLNQVGVVPAPGTRQRACAAMTSSILG